MRKINATASLLLLFLFAGSALAQGMLQGTVTTPEGTPLPGACCLYLNQEGLEKRIGPQSTRGGGYYRFSNVNPGMYMLEAEIPGFAPMKIPVRVFAAEPTKNDIRLTKEKEEEELVVRKYFPEECATIRIPPVSLKPHCDPRIKMYFSEGIAPVRIGCRYGYIDKKGNAIITPRFNKAGIFSEGLAAVKIRENWIYINKKGESFLPYHNEKGENFWGWYASACPFSGGVAAVRWGCGGSDWVLINKNGEVVARKEGEEPLRGCATDSFLGSGFAIKSGAESRIERLPKIEEAPETPAPEKFSEGLVKFQDEQGKWGYMDKHEKIAIPPQFDSALDFSEGLAVVEIDGKWGYVNRAGKMVIDPQYDSAEKFSEGLAYVVIGIRKERTDETGKRYIMLYDEHRYINKKGGIIWKIAN